jgi:hypothetical protein
MLRGDKGRKEGDICGDIKVADVEVGEHTKFFISLNNPRND